MMHLKKIGFVAFLSFVALGCGGGGKKSDTTVSTTSSSSAAATSSTSSNTNSSSTSSTQTSEQVALKPVAGSVLNPFFPTSEGDFKVVFTQEKEGFSQAKLNKAGKEVATLSIADAANNPSAIADFASVSDKIGKYPMVAKGNLGTAVLVGNRFQVQVRSKNASFAEADRKAWVEKFKLSDLEGVK